MNELIDAILFKLSKFYRIPTLIVSDDEAEVKEINRSIKLLSPDNIKHKCKAVLAGKPTSLPRFENIIVHARILDPELKFLLDGKNPNFVWIKRHD